MLETHTDTHGAFRKPTSVICNKYALLIRMFQKRVVLFIVEW